MSLITDLPEDNDILDSDLFVVGDESHAILRQAKFSTIFQTVLSKSVPDLRTDSKTIFGALNELYGDLNVVSAYDHAVARGYTGTESEFEQLMYDLATAAATVQGYLQDATEVANSIPSDYSAMSADVEDLKDSVADISETADRHELEIGTKAPAICETTSGDLVVFETDAGDMPLKSLVVDIPLVQSGTGDPSPENVRPITGWTGVKVVRTGKNLLGGKTLGDAIVDAVNVPSNTYLGSDAEGDYVTFSGNNALTGVRFTNGMRFKPNTQYTFIITAKRNPSDGNSQSTNLMFFYTDGTYTAIGFPTAPSAVAKSTFAYTSAANRTIQCIGTYWGSGRLYLYYNESGIFEGELTANDFTPYTGDTYDISFPTEAGTIACGTVDVTKGTLTVDRAMVDLGTLNWSLGKRNNADTGYIFSKNFASMAVNSSPACEKYALQRVGTFPWEALNKGCLGVNGSILVFCDDYADAAAFKTAVTGTHLVYELATPQTYTLTPQAIRTLLGYNALWADAGSITECAYPVDSTECVDKLSEEIDGIANTVDTKAPAIYSTASGALAAFSDGAYDMPIKSLTVGIEPVQAGTGDPSPDNIRPITGWTGVKVARTGKNIAKIATVSSAAASQKNVTDNSITVYSTIAQAGYRYVKASVLDVARLAGKTVTISLRATQEAGSSTPYVIGAYFKNGNRVGNNLFELSGTTIVHTLTIPSTVEFGTQLMLNLYCDMGSGGPSETEYTDIQIEFGSTATAYEPYTGDTYDIALPTSAGTVYGGTLDVTAGTLTVDRATKVISAITSLAGSNYIKSDATDGYIVDSDISPKTGAGTFKKNVLSDTLKYKTAYIWASVGHPNCFNIHDQQIHINIANDLLGITDPSSETTATAKEKLNAYLAAHPVTITIPVAPQTYTLDPTTIRTLLGYNAMWADCGDIEDVTYPADTKLYVDNLLTS